MQLIHSIIEPRPGLLYIDETDSSELCGYSVTMDGEIVAQEWPSDLVDYIGDDLLWEDLRPETDRGRRAA